MPTAAVAAAQFETPSMKHYQGGSVTETGGDIGVVVHTYLSARLNLSHCAISESPNAHITLEERAKYIALAEKKVL
jgi:hypothetical protein